MALGDDDIPTMLAELGITVRIAGSGAAPVYGIVRQFNETEHDFPGAGELVTRGVVITIQTGSLGQPGPNPGQTLEVDGVSNYKVQKSMAREHGRLTQILCEVINPTDWVDE